MEIVEVGTIFYNMWGYDQTNIDWYQVVSKTPKTITVKAIECVNVEDTPTSMTGVTTPISGAFKPNAKPHRRSLRVTPYGIKANAEYGSLSVWDGKPKHYSTYA